MKAKAATCIEAIDTAVGEIESLSALTQWAFGAAAAAEGDERATADAAALYGLIFVQRLVDERIDTIRRQAGELTKLVKDGAP